MPRHHVISDRDFWGALEACGGLYSKTVAYIEKHHNERITRQAVYQRAIQNPERLKAIKESVVDLAEDAVISNIKQKDNLHVKQRAAEYYLRHKGRDRGYGDSPEDDSSEGTGAIAKLPNGDDFEY